jgi:hypothetical protein
MTASRGRAAPNGFGCVPAHGARVSVRRGARARGAACQPRALELAEAVGAAAPAAERGASDSLGRPAGTSSLMLAVLYEGCLPRKRFWD